ncbi:MAG: ABC transporter permease subunit [Demequina sp.]|jgi:ABC-2 type transport system permease protein|nr:ABC transporter permease subunit [Demequina sp.]
MNAVIMRLALRSLLGSRRVWILIGLSVLLFAVAGLTRWGSGGAVDVATGVIVNFGFGLLVPIMCLLIGTGVIAPEIEDGSIVYLLAKPVPRRTIALSKLVVAVVVAVVFCVASVVIAAEIAGDKDGQLALSMGVATALASVAYVAVFFMIAVLTRNSIIVGLLYALLWEGVLAGYVPGVRTLSVRQWALAPAEKMLEGNTDIAISSDVSLAAGVILLAAVTVGSVVVAIQRLKVLSVRVSE